MELPVIWELERFSLSELSLAEVNQTRVTHSQRVPGIEPLDLARVTWMLGAPFLYLAILATKGFHVAFRRNVVLSVRAF
jgi:hypothetical protein